MPESISIPLHNGGVAWIDAADLPLVTGRTWYRRDKKHTSYAYCHGEHGQIQMHRLLLGATYRQLVDHEDGNGLNNRRENICLCTAVQNNANQQKTRGTSQYKGVHFHKQSGKWRAEIAGRWLGHFTYEANAALAYNAAAEELFGAFARLNPVAEDEYTPEPPMMPRKKSPKPVKPPQRIRKGRIFTPPKIALGKIVTLNFNG